MKAMIVYAHPYNKSYNRAILDATINGLKKANHEIDLVDLYKDRFDPVLNTKNWKLSGLTQSGQNLRQRYSQTNYKKIPCFFRHGLFLLFLRPSGI